MDPNAQYFPHPARSAKFIPLRSCHGTVSNLQREIFVNSVCFVNVVFMFIYFRKPCLETFLREYADYPFPTLGMVYPVAACHDFTYYTRYGKFRSHWVAKHQELCRLFKCDMCGKFLKIFSNKNSHKRNHPGENCTFSNKFVPNEHYISPDDIRFPLPPSGEKLPTSLETDNHFIAHKRTKFSPFSENYSLPPAKTGNPTWERKVTLGYKPRITGLRKCPSGRLEISVKSRCRLPRRKCTCAFQRQNFRFLWQLMYFGADTSPIYRKTGILIASSLDLNDRKNHWQLKSANLLRLEYTEV